MENLFEKLGEILKLQTDANVLLCEVPCPACNGDGYTAEHACDGTEGMCAITCPQQVQCSYCCATGKIQVPKK